jgi:hypothetical protein
MDYKLLFSFIPKSDEQLGKDIGISAKTIKRLRTGTYKPKTKRTHHLVMGYLYGLRKVIDSYIQEDKDEDNKTKPSIKKKGII